MVVSGHDTIAAEWTLVAVSFVFVAFRAYVRLIHQGQAFVLSDYFVTTAWLGFVSCCACDTVLNSLGLMKPGRTYTSDLTTISDDPKVVVKLLKIVYGSSLPYYLDLWLIKGALLCFYYTIIPATLSRHRKALYFVTGVVAATFIVVITINSFWCLPVWRNWTLDKKSICFSFASVPAFCISVGCNIITDFMILALPFPLLRNLDVKRTQLYGLIFVFALGGLCIIVSIARCVALALEATVTQVAIWTACESSIGLMVACTPALRVLLRKRRPAGYSNNVVTAERVTFGSTGASTRMVQAPGIKGSTLNDSTIEPDLETTTLVQTNGGEWINLEEQRKSTTMSSPPTNFSRSFAPRDEDEEDNNLVIEEYYPTKSFESITKAKAAEKTSTSPLPRSRKPSDEEDWLKRELEVGSPDDEEARERNRRPSYFLNLTPDSSSEALPLPRTVIISDDISGQARAQRERWEEGMKYKGVR